MECTLRVRPTLPDASSRSSKMCRKGGFGAMTDSDSIVLPELDRDSFTTHTRYAALQVPVSKCSKTLKDLAVHILKIPKISPVVKPAKGEESDNRTVILKSIINDDGQKEPPLSQDVLDYVEKEGLEVAEYVLTTGYSILTVDEVLKKLLPDGVEVPSSFETVGHVAHLNLRDNLLPYKKVIAEVILEKNPRIRTIVNKVGSIASEYRTFQYEVLAGDSNLDVEVKEGGATFAFNYAEVYWNSRLQGEHARMVKLIPNTSIVWDMCAGVGPFAVPLALKGCQVYANDLNPRSYHFLKVNAQKNKVGSKLEAFNMCGREFIKQRTAAKLPVHHILMNLPNSALEFLDLFPGRFDYMQTPPMLHVYCFSKAADPVADALQRARDIMGQEVPSSVRVHTVRDVAPRKPMLCLSFPAPTQPSPSTCASAQGDEAGGAAKRKAEQGDGVGGEKEEEARAGEREEGKESKRMKGEEAEGVDR